MSNFSALEILVYSPSMTVKEKQIRSQIMQIPYLRQLIHDKWTTYAMYMFYFWLATYMFFLVVLSLFLIHSTTGTLDETTFWGLLSYLLGFSLVSIYFELFDLVRMGRYYFFQSSLVFQFMGFLYGMLIVAYFILACFNGSQMNCNLTQVYETYENLTDVPGPFASPDELPLVCVASNTLLSLAAFFAWIYLLFFTTGFSALSLFVISLKEILVRDLVPFAMVFFTWSMAFGLAFFPIWKSDSNFHNIGTVLFTTIQISIYSINFSYTDIDTSNPTPLVAIFFILAIFILGVCLTNMLIAAMSCTYDEIQEQAKDQRYFQFVSVVLLIERRVKFLLHWVKLSSIIKISEADHNKKGDTKGYNQKTAGKKKGKKMAAKNDKKVAAEHPFIAAIRDSTHYFHVEEYIENMEFDAD